MAAAEEPTRKSSRGWLWIVTGVVAVLVIMAWLRRPWPQCLQLAGGGLQLVGVLTVALEIARKRREVLGKAPLARSGLDALMRALGRLRRKRQPVTGDIEHTTEADLARSITPSVDRSEDLSLEEQIEEFRTRLEEHEKRFDGVENQLDRERAERETEVESLRREAENLHRRLSERIEHAAAGGLTIEMWGAALFALGILLTTVGLVV